MTPCQQTTGVPQWTRGQRRVTTSAALRHMGTGDMACVVRTEEQIHNAQTATLLSVSTLGRKPQKIRFAQ